MIDLERGPARGLDVTTSGTGELAGSRPFRPGRLPLRAAIARDQQEAAETRRRVWWEIRDRLGHQEMRRLLGFDPWRAYAGILDRAAFWIDERRRPA